jgi:hypothetical protein
MRARTHAETTQSLSKVFAWNSRIGLREREKEMEIKHV